MICKDHPECRACVDDGPEWQDALLDAWNDPRTLRSLIPSLPPCLKRDAETRLSQMKEDGGW